MKKIIQTIKLRKFKTNVPESALKLIEHDAYIVCYKDMTYNMVHFKDDLVRVLEKDHIKPIWYIFDMVDRIKIDRDVLIDVSEV